MAAKKTVKQASKKATPKKAAAGKTTVKKTTAKKTTSKKTSAKKPPAKRSTPKKTTAKKTAARKTTVTKTTAKKTPSKKTAPKKSTAKKAMPKKSTAKKATPKKTTPKKTTAKKATPKKTTPKKAAPKKTQAKQAPSKGSAPEATDKPLREIDRKPVAPKNRKPLMSRPVDTPKPAPKPRAVKLDKQALAKIKAQLLEEKAEHEERLRDLEQDSFESSQSDMTGEAGFNDDFADAGTATFDRERDLSIRNNVLDLIDQVTRALRRIDDGLYGTCENCGNPIDAARIKAFPRVLLCLDCKRREERSR